MSHRSPASLTCLLLELVLPARYRDAILGDLIEEHAVLTKSSSPFAASCWFWSQICRSMPFLAWLCLRDGWLVNLCIAITVFAGVAAFKVAVDLAISKLFSPEPMTHVVLAPILFLSATTMAGCITARLRRGATVCLALIVVLTVVALMALNRCTIPVPWWYQFGFLTLGPLSVLVAPMLVRFPKARAGEAAT